MTNVAAIAACTLGGLAVGMAYFALVWRTAAQLASGDMRVAGAVGAIGLRMLLFAPGAVVAGMLSLLSLAGYVFGFLAARVVMVHSARLGKTR